MIFLSYRQQAEKNTQLKNLHVVYVQSIYFVTKK